MKVRYGGVYPYDSKWRWLMQNRYSHLVEAIQDHVDDFHQPYRRVLIARAKRLKVAVRVRAAVLFLLNVGIAATVALFLLQLLPLLEGVAPVISLIARVGTTFSALLTAVYLLLTRYLGQLEADVISAMALGSPGAPQLDDEARRRIERLEEESDREGPTPGRA